MRIGFGYDVHPLIAGRPLILGGVTIPCEQGLDGHSDADVVVHALCDAMLGALALGDWDTTSRAQTNAGAACRVYICCST